MLKLQTIPSIFWPIPLKATCKLNDESWSDLSSMSIKLLPGLGFALGGAHGLCAVSA